MATKKKKITATEEAIRKALQFEIVRSQKALQHHAKEVLQKNPLRALCSESAIVSAHMIAICISLCERLEDGDTAEKVLNLLSAKLRRCVLDQGNCTEVLKRASTQIELRVIDTLLRDVEEIIRDA